MHAFLWPLVESFVPAPPERVAREYVRRVASGDLVRAATLLSREARAAVLADGFRAGAGLGLLGFGEPRVSVFESCRRGDHHASVSLRVDGIQRSLLRQIELAREVRHWRVCAPAGGRLTIDAHPWGAVYVDGVPVRDSGRGTSGVVIGGKRVAITPILDLPLVAGWHQVRVDHLDLARGDVRMRAVRDVEVPAGGSATIVVRLEPVTES